MSFQTFTKEYLRAFQEICNSTWKDGAKSVEMATRPVVHNYISELIGKYKSDSSEVIIHHDVNYTRKDRPDWRVEDHKTFGIFCFGDHKNLAIGKSFQLTKAEQKQIDRYISFGRPVFVFDGIEFLFYKPGEKSPKRVQLVKKSDTSKENNWSDLEINSTLENIFRDILNNPGFRKWTENELIEQLAVRCRFIADELSYLLSAPKGSGMSENEEDLIKSLHSLRKIIIDHHDASLRSDQSCADFIAQVLTFGLFYAHTRFASVDLSPELKSEEIKTFWNLETLDEQAKRLRPFQAIVYSLSDPLQTHNALSEWYNEILGVLAHAEYMGTDKGPQDFHALFERFLSLFDEKARFDRGAFYTPKVLSDWIVRASNDLSSQEFGTKILSAATNIIDPCCGTGSFLESIKLLTEDEASLENKLIGFEILPAPYALTHYRLSQIYEEDELNNISILLTDTLSDALHDYSGNEQNGFSAELQEAVTSCNLPLRLVIGNPPSSNHPINSSPRSIIENLMEDFRPPKKARTDRQNIQKALNNEAYRFLRWCGERVLESERGILSLVLPGAFSQSVSFKYARKWLVDNFDSIYVLEIDQDARRADPTKSLFSVLQGRLVLLATYDKSSKKSSKVFYSSIGSLNVSEKKNFLASNVDLTSFINVTVDEPNWSFVDNPDYPRDLWNKCIPLIGDIDNSVFLSKCSAVKLAPTAALFHTHKPTLARRTLELSGKQKSLSIEKTIDRWFKGQRKPPAVKKFTDDVQSALSKTKPSDDFTSYLFRPFVNGWVVENDDVFSALSAAPGGGTRARPEIRKAFDNGSIGIALAPAPADLGATLTRFSCFAWNLPDNDIAARGNAMIYCDKFPKKTKSGLSGNIANVNGVFCKHFQDFEDPLQSALFYTYAILSSRTYLDTFEGALYKPSDPDNPPRIPLVESKKIREEISVLGKQIAECENFSTNYPIDDKFEIEHGEPFKTFCLLKSNYDEINEKFYLLGEDSQVVICNVTPDIAGLDIAGHTVLDKWVREKTFSYLRREFSTEDLTEFIQLLSRISYQLDLIKTVDGLLDNVFDQQAILSVSN